MEYCKYSIRDHINTLEKYYIFISKYNNINYKKSIIIKNNILKRINRLKDYLCIEYTKPTKLSLTERFRNNLKYIKEE